MKLLVLSDVHSNICALESISKAEGQWDALLFAGDMVDYGLHPREVVDWLEFHKAICVSGNHDRAVVELYKNPENLLPETAPYRFIDYNVRALSPRNYDYLKALPEYQCFSFDGFDYLMIHSFVTSPGDYDIIESRAQFEEFWRSYAGEPKPDAKRRIIFGHTHRSCVHILSDNMLWLNPGSASYRRVGDPFKGADYAVITDGEISLRYTDYPSDELLRKAEALNLTLHEMAHARSFYEKTSGVKS